MNTILTPQDQVFWYLKRKNPPLPYEPLQVDVVVVGGGMAGLSAAQSFFEKGYSVALLEKYYCGSGASGKSSGFITPDSELNLSYFRKRFGPTEAHRLWEFVIRGVRFIEQNIKQFQLNCDYSVEDTLVVANSTGAMSSLMLEDKTRKELLYDSILYDKNSIKKAVGSTSYAGGVRYSNTFGINAYAYCQGMKEILESRGVKIFEETPVIKIHSRGVDTLHTTVKAEHVVVCADRFIPDFNKQLGKHVFHAQTFLMISEPLPQDTIRAIFPEKNLMVWDTDLIYQYYRVNSGNRLMVGGSNLVSIFWGTERHNYEGIYQKLTRYMREKFPQAQLNFEYYWPGLIGVSKDFMPLAGNDPDNPHIYYIGGAAGLPWAAALGMYAAERVALNTKNFDDYFKFDRSYPIGPVLQAVLGKRITFSLSTTLTTLKK